MLIFQKIARKVGTSGWVRGTNTRLFCKTNFFFHATKPPPGIYYFLGVIIARNFLKLKVGYYAMAMNFGSKMTFKGFKAVNPPDSKIKQNGRLRTLRQKISLPGNFKKCT